MKAVEALRKATELHGFVIVFPDTEKFAWKDIDKRAVFWYSVSRLICFRRNRIGRTYMDELVWRNGSATDL